MTEIAIAGAVVLVLMVLAVLVIYNGLVRKRNMVDESWSGVDVQLRRRHDLVPNIVNAVAGYAAHESKVLTAVTADRAAAEQADGAAQATPAETALAGHLVQLLALAEAYPDLQASENFVELQRELANLENQIVAARTIYNANVRNYNTRVQSIPAAIVAKAFGFDEREFFAAAETDRVLTEVAI